ncbi:MAG: hypothetical protein WD993_08580 [Thermoleophilaceae bacterium]
MAKAIAATAAAAAIASVACAGDSSGDETQVRAALVELQRAYAANDVARGCRLLTYDAQVQAGSAAHGQPGFCRPSLRRAWDFLRGSNPNAYDTVPAIAAVAIGGERATATIIPRRGTTAEVALRREDGRWRLDDFFGESGGSAAGDEPLPGRPVATMDPTGAPCPAVRAGDGTRIRGGCNVVARGEIVLVVRNAFGASLFARCSYRLIVRVDGGGRTWTMPLSISNEGACGDVDFCTDRRGRTTAWTGAFRRADGVRHHVDTCFRTCIGRFHGRIAMGVERTERGLRATAANEAIAGGSLEVDTEWSFRPRRIVLAETR